MRMYDYHGPTGIIRQAVITLIGRMVELEFEGIYLSRCFFQDCTGSRGAKAWEDTCVRLLLLSTPGRSFSYDRKLWLRLGFTVD